MKKRMAVLATLVALVAAGCSSADTTESDPGEAPTVNLSAMREAAGIPDCPEPEASEQVPGGLPDVTLSCLGSDRSLNLVELPSGPTIINIWAQWCPPCREEAPYLASFARAAEGKVSMLGVDFADPDPQLAIEFAGLSEWTYPHLTDIDKKLSAQLGVTGVPTTVFVTEDGTISYIHVGPFANEEHLRALTAQHLGVQV